MERGKLIKFVKLPAAKRQLVFEACVALFLAKILVALCSFNTVAKMLGKANKVSGGRLSGKQLLLKERIRHALAMVSPHVPWTSVCLDQALAAMIMLNRRRVPNTLYLGVKFNREMQKLDAHAWVECNDSIFIGGAHSKDYRSVAFFSNY